MMTHMTSDLRSIFFLIIGMLICNAAINTIEERAVEKYKATATSQCAELVVPND